MWKEEHNFQFADPELVQKTPDKGHTRTPQEGCWKQSISTPLQNWACISRYIISDSKADIKSIWLPWSSLHRSISPSYLQGANVTEMSQIKIDKPPF